MCLILIAWQRHPDFPLVVAANRDEFFARPSAPAAHWADTPEIIAGRDLEAGGTWLGMTGAGRFAAVTNVREPGAPTGSVSRGRLTQDFLNNTEDPLGYAKRISNSSYSGFNLLLAGSNQLVYASNRDGPPRTLAPGIYGVSNHLLDSPWPKLVSAKERFTRALERLPETSELFAILADRQIVPDECLPQTGVPLDWERLLSAIFVSSPTYGTRTSTVLSVTADRTSRLEERSFGPGGQATQTSVISTGV